MELFDIELPQNNENESKTQDAWQDLLSHHFPREDQRDDQRIQWTIYRETYATRPGSRPHSSTPHMVLVRTPILLNQTERRLTSHRYSHLFVETRPSVRDTPTGWEELLRQAAWRLSIVCGQRHDVLLICAVGLRYMIFRWDSISAGSSARPPLRGRGDNGEEYVLPTQLRPVRDFMPHVSKHFIIDPRRALKLNCSCPTEGNKALEIFFNNARLERPSNPSPYI